MKKEKLARRYARCVGIAALLSSTIMLVATGAQSQTKKPNILILWGDDIGYWNISAYNQGMMGYKTPNIDRIAKEGALFTDWYGQQSCTAGRAAFITGQCAHSHRPHQGGGYGLYALDARSHVCVRAGGHLRRAMAAKLPRIPTAPEA